MPRIRKAFVLKAGGARFNGPRNVLSRKTFIIVGNDYGISIA